MTQFGCRPWNLSLISVIVLVVSNMFLTFLLLQSEPCQPPVPQQIVLDESAGKRQPGQQSDHQQSEGSSSESTTIRTGTDKPQCPSACARSSQEQQLAGLEESSPLNLDLRLGRWDSRRLYRLFDSVMVGSHYADLSQSSKVCLATQTSLEKLSSVVQVVHQWTGPLSVALYAAGDEEFEVTQMYLEYMRRCYEPVRERVVFSIAIPKNRTPMEQPRFYPLPDFLDCQKPERTLKELTGHVSKEQADWRIRNVYPQNHMRNLARKNCQTDYVFLTDVDVVPSFNLSVYLETFLRKDNCDKCAFVIPTYELDARVRFPQNKTELIRLAKKGLARPFHQKVFIHNQFATNFSRWAMDASPEHKNYENVRNGVVYVSHDVTNFEFLYEPFYVAKDVSPPHDERFMGYGYTRNTQQTLPFSFLIPADPKDIHTKLQEKCPLKLAPRQKVYEMFVAGYQFKVLSPVFTVHWGLQTRKTRPVWRERQNSANRKQFEIFKKEIFSRYSRDPLKMIKKT